MIRAIQALYFAAVFGGCFLLAGLCARVARWRRERHQEPSRWEDTRPEFTREWRRGA